MKHLILYIGVVVGMTALIISCSSDDDAAKSTATSAAVTPTVASSCTGNETVSTVTGDGIARVIGELRYAAETGNEDNVSTVRNREISGRYSLTIDNSTTSACIDNSTGFLGNMGFPASVLGIKHQLFVTSSSTITVSSRYFSDSSCASQTGFLVMTYDNVTVGDNVTTMLGPVYDNVSGAVLGDAGSVINSVNIGFPQVGTKISMNRDRVCMYGSDNDTRNVVNSMSPYATHKLLDNDSFSTVLDNDTSGVTTASGWQYNYEVVTSLIQDSWEGWDSSKNFLITSRDNSSGYPDNYTEVCCTPGGAHIPEVWFQDNASN